MKIADFEGEIYTVNKPEELVASVDNDLLLTILTATQFSVTLQSNIDQLVSKGLIEKLDTNESPALELQSGVDFLSKILTERLGEEKVSEAIERAKTTFSNKEKENEEPQ